MVDRIGKGGAPPPVTGNTGTPAAEKTGKTFEAEKPAAATATRQAAAIEAAPLEQLKTGKIDFDRYLDLKVDEATSHLQGLAPDQIDSIRSMLRDRMATDPELVDLVKQATGHAPNIPDE